MASTHNILKLAGSKQTQTVLEFIRAYYADDRIPFDEPRVRKGLGVLLQDPALGKVFLIQDWGLNAGYLILTFAFDLEFGGREAFVTDLYIASEHRGKGLGKRAFEELERLCPTLGINALELQVERDNLEAQAFYQNLGFQVHSRIPMSKALVPKSG